MQECVASVCLACFMALGLIRGHKADSIYICTCILLTWGAQYLLVDSFIINCLCIVIYSAFLRAINSHLIKSSISVLIMYSILSFCLDITDLIFYTDFTWSLIQSWANLYVYVYYVTIFLIFAGLAKGDQGGHRDICTRDNVLFANHNSINFRWI